MGSKKGALRIQNSEVAVVFFTAIFPQFFVSKTIYLIQFGILLSVCAFIAFTCFMTYAIAGSKIVSVFSSTSVGKYIKRIIGVTFIGVGVGLAASNK